MTPGSYDKTDNRQPLGAYPFSWSHETRHLEQVGFLLITSRSSKLSGQFLGQQLVEHQHLSILKIIWRPTSPKVDPRLSESLAGADS